MDYPDKRKFNKKVTINPTNPTWWYHARIKLLIRQKNHRKMQVKK